MAEALARHHAKVLGAADRIAVDSAGTQPFLPGGPAHPGTLAILRERGIDGSGLTGRGVVAADFDRFDRILAVDRMVLLQLQRLAKGATGSPRLELLLRPVAGEPVDVPDPFLDGGFAAVFRLLDRACRALVAEVVAEGGPEQGGAARIP